MSIEEVNLNNIMKIINKEGNESSNLTFNSNDFILLGIVDIL